MGMPSQEQIKNIKEAKAFLRIKEKRRGKRRKGGKEDDKGYAVIGANAGTKVKAISDYLCLQVENPLVISFNGGGQAGHTVSSPEGIRHVFSHFGSGTLAGAPTYLSKYFIVNPILFNREYDVLVEKGIVPRVYVSPECIVTTPFDMMINQAIGKARRATVMVRVGMVFLRLFIVTRTTILHWWNGGERFSFSS